ncbi:FxsA family protein [Bailinhaonella thermotolerans]|uniref:FxsA family protein n=1 Tax=Bailinhaonella thermotolerans TaxID=1070861 RepID=A0A3A4B2I9_9ACTN|nr:FxsA family protein [Bailinhaonella thermotolerans]RJL35371.1 FxsA family protein [Bailinhaonella thermotolerans]
MGILLFLAFLVVPVLEIWMIIQVGTVIGGWQTVFVLLAMSVLGSWLVRREGRRAWRALQDAVSTGVMPDRQLVDAGMVLAGGVLLLTPGFLTDVVGILLVVPATRPLVRGLLLRVLKRRVRTLAERSPYASMMFPPGAPQDPGAAPWPGAGHAPGGTASPGRGRVVTGEVVDD